MVREIMTGIYAGTEQIVLLENDKTARNDDYIYHLLQVAPEEVKVRSFIELSGFNINISFAYIGLYSCSYHSQNPEIAGLMAICEKYFDNTIKLYKCIDRFEPRGMYGSWVVFDLLKYGSNNKISAEIKVDVFLNANFDVIKKTGVKLPDYITKILPTNIKNGYLTETQKTSVVIKLLKHSIKSKTYETSK